MKLRMEAGSIRVRLKQAEVAQFAETGRIESSVEFAGGQRLNYGLRSAAEVTEPRASFLDGLIEIAVPQASVRPWAESSEVAITAASGPLLILIEKDFQCLHKDEEANAGAYPNPNRYN